MARLLVQLLGTPRLVFDGEDKTEQLIGYKKAFALLIYLLVKDSAQSRLSLAALLWPDLPESDGLTNLRGRSGLWRLNKVLPGVLQTDIHEVALHPTVDITCDYTQFQTLLSGRANVAKLRDAVALYRAAFCRGFFPPEDAAEDYERWFYSQREQLEQSQLWALSRLVEVHIKLHLFAAARKYTAELVRLDPLNEDGHRWLMQLYAWEDQRNLALNQYATYRQQLLARTGVTPGRKLEQLHDEIKTGNLPLPEPAPFLAPALPPHMVPRPALHQQITAQIGPAGAIALVGMAGIGKSTLATQLAHDLRVEFPDGVLWADMGATPPAEILVMWSMFYGYDLQNQPTLESRQTAWRGITQDKRILIVLDGVTHSEDARPLLSHSPGCAILITTRSHDVAATLNARRLEMRLFDERAGVALLKNILPGRTAQESQAAVAICDLLEGLPLALEIMAQRLHTRSPLTLAGAYDQLQHIRSRLDILQLEDRAVRTSFELSWKGLSQPLQALFAALSSFSGRPFHATAVQAMTGAGQTGTQLDDLAALSLVQRLSDGYYRQHALLAEFAAEKVQEMHLDMAHFEQRLIPYYAEFVQQHAQNYARLRQEWGNLQAALDLAHRRRDWASVYNLGRQMTTAWFVRARYSDARRAYRLCYDAARMLEDDEGVARTLLDWGRACMEQGDYPEAWERLDESLRVFNEHLKDQVGAAEVQLDRGRLAFEQSRWEDAHQWLAEAQQVLDQHDLPHLAAIAKYRRAGIAYHEENYEEANRLCSAALKSLPGEKCIPALNLLADIFMQMGELEAAENTLRDAQELCAAANDKANAAIVAGKFGRLLRRQGDFVQARKFRQNSLEMLRKMGDRKGEAYALFDLSRIAHDEGDFALAARQAQECLTMFEGFEDTYNILNTLALLGLIYRGQGKNEPAALSWQRAYKLAEQLDNQRFQQVIHNWLQEI